MKKILENLRGLADKFKQAQVSETTYKRNVFKQEYKILTGSYRKAIILDHLLFNHNLTDWVRKSAKQLTEELCFDCHPRTVARDLKEMEQDGILLSRNHINPWIKDRQWQVQISPVCERLETIQSKSLSHEKTQCPTEATPDPTEVNPVSTQKQKHLKSDLKQTTQEPVVALYPSDIEDLAVANKDLLDRLTSEVKGLKLKTALALISRFGREAVENQLNWLPTRNARKPAAMLNKALEMDYSAPTEIQEQQEAQNSKEAHAGVINKAQAMIESLSSGAMVQIGQTVLKYVRQAGGSVVVALDGQESILPKARFAEAVAL